MQKKKRYGAFVMRRAEIFQGLDRIRLDIDVWLSEHRNNRPNMIDVATLEGLHGERMALLHDLQEAESDFVSFCISLAMTKPEAATVDNMAIGRVTVARGP